MPKLNGRVVVPTTRSAAADPTTSATFVDRADHYAAVSREHRSRARPQLGERDRDGHAHRAQGVTAGAKVQVMTVLDLLMKPELVEQAWDYFRNVQTKDKKYTPLIRPEDKPAIWLNQETMAKYREQMKKFYYDPTKYPTYLEQLGIKYPTREVGRSGVGKRMPSFMTRRTKRTSCAAARRCGPTRSAGGARCLSRRCCGT